MGFDMWQKSLKPAEGPLQHSCAIAIERQTGLTLVELMVGVTIGMLIVAVAIGALMVSHGASSTVTEAAQLQQQASYAFRILGQQIRQAGSLELNLDTETNQGTSTSLSAGSKVAFLVGYNRWDQIITGVDAPGSTQFALTVGHQNYAERLGNEANEIGSLFRDCLGQGGVAVSGSYPRIISRFALRNGELVCRGTAGQAQAIIQNVAGFQVWYYTQTGAASGAPRIGRVPASEVANWADVVAVEVCLDMVGSHRADVPESSRYRNCQDQSVRYGDRIHQVYRNVFQLRSQGVLGG